MAEKEYEEIDLSRRTSVVRRVSIRPTTNEQRSTANVSTVNRQLSTVNFSSPHQTLKQVDELRHMIAVHQCMVHMNGNRHRSLLSFQFHFSEGNLGAAVCKGESPCMRKAGELYPRNGGVMNDIFTRYSRY